MFEKYINFIQNNSFAKKINGFTNSIFYIYTMAIFVIVSNIFALELIGFLLITLLVSFALFFNPDTKIILAPILYYQMAFSYLNGLSYNKYPNDPHLFSNPMIQIYLFVLIGIIALSFAFNFFTFKQYKKILLKSKYVIPGLLVLLIGYMLGGIFSSNYTFNNLLFSLSNVAMIIAMVVYIIDTSFLDNKKIIKYISHLMIATIVIISIQLINIYISNNVIRAGEIQKWYIRTGWGIHNNFAGYLCIAYPFIFYLAKENKKFLLFVPISGLAIAFTLSRNGILIFAIELIITFIFALKKAKISKKNIAITLLISSTFIAFIFVVFHKEIINLFATMIETGFDFNGRDEIYSFGINEFINNPVFGSGWFTIDKLADESLRSPTNFAPSLKYHNIVIQLLACCGIFGLLCFIFFIYHITHILLKNKNIGSIICYLAIIVLIISSIFDNFFFDYGFERFLAIFIIGISICKEEKKNYY